MIFGIKTRKELKKEIKDLKTALDKAYFDLPLSRVNVVFDNRPIATLKAGIDIYDYDARSISGDCVIDILESKISHGLREYMTVESCYDPRESAHRITGTLMVVVPKGKEREDAEIH